MSGSVKKDYLKRDPVLPGQDFVLVSFVNPKDAVVAKCLHYINNFMVDDINKTLTAQVSQMVRLLQVEMRSKIEDVLNKLKFSVEEEDKIVLRKLEENYKNMAIDEESFIEKCRRRYTINDEEIHDKYKIYLSSERTRLDNMFNNANGNITSLRGFKIRGTFSTLDEAKERAKFLRDTVEQSVHIFVVPVGTWFPIDIDADEVQDQEYMVDELNELMGKYHEGTHARNKFYRERQAEAVETSEQHIKSKVTHDGSDRRERMMRKLQEQQAEKFKASIEESAANVGEKVNITKPSSDGKQGGSGGGGSAQKIKSSKKKNKNKSTIKPT